MIDNEPESGVAARYRRFAEHEARGRSPLYEALAYGVAGDAELQGFLGGLPPEKRQPNLLLAAARYLAGVQSSYDAFRSVVLDRRDEVAAVMLARRTQTNEPARCATLLPALAALPQPLALLEVGASAGLCLLPDRYSYDYDGYRLDGPPAAPVFACQIHGPVPLPARLPQVVWRAGVDLNPLNLTNPDDLHWLSSLVWPGESGRAEQLEAAVQLVRREPPPLIRGDLVDQLAATAADAPREATLVVFHSAVLAYVSPQCRLDFAAAVAELDAVWLANESPSVLSCLPGFPDDLPGPAPSTDPFLLTRNGRNALAFTDGHGTWIHWLA